MTTPNVHRHNNSSYILCVKVFFICFIALYLVVLIVIQNYNEVFVPPYNSLIFGDYEF